MPSSRAVAAVATSVQRSARRQPAPGNSTGIAHTAFGHARDTVAMTAVGDPSGVPEAFEPQSFEGPQVTFRPSTSTVPGSRVGQLFAVRQTCHVKPSGRS